MIKVLEKLGAVLSDVNVATVLVAVYVLALVTEISASGVIF